MSDLFTEVNSVCSGSRHRIIVGVLVAVSVCGVAGVVLAVYFASKLTENLVLVYIFWCICRYGSKCAVYIIFFICLFFPPSLASNNTHDSSGKTSAWKEGLVLFHFDLCKNLGCEFLHFLHQFHHVLAEVSFATNRC